MTEKNIIRPSWLQPIQILTLSVLVVIIYYPSLGVPFTFDDFPNIVGNPHVQPENFSRIINAVHSPHSSSRPLAMLSFAVNFWLDKLDVSGYHLVNIIIHVINTILLYKIIIIFPGIPLSNSSLPESRSIKLNLAFWSTALWAVNPVQTQAVTYIVQRMTSMAALFYLGAIYTFILWRNKSTPLIRALPVIIACFALGLASKEIIITLPLTLLLLDYLFYSRHKPRRNLLTASLILVLIVIIGLIYLKGKLPDWFTTYPDRNFSPWERVMTEWRVVWHYLSIYFLPLPDRLHLAYDMTVSRSLLNPWTTLTGLLAMLGAWLAAWRFRCGFPASVFGILFFFLALSVESTFADLELAFLHRLYLPSAFLVFAILIILPHKIMRKTGVLLLLLIALWSFWTITRNDEWNKMAEFWGIDLNRGGGAARTLNNKAASLMVQGDLDNAISVLKEGLARAPNKIDRQSLLYNLGCALYIKKEYQESLMTFKTMQEETGPFIDSLLYVGMIYLAQGREDDARELAAILKKEEKRYYQGIILESNIAKMEKRYEEAEKMLKQALQEKSASVVTVKTILQQELANLYLDQGRFEDAYNIYLEIVELYPDSYAIWRRIYYMLEAGRDEKNSEIIRQFLKSKGIDVETTLNKNPGSEGTDKKAEMITSF